MDGLEEVRLTRGKLVGAGVVVAGVLLLALLWTGRTVVSRLIPITHTGEVMRIATFHKGGIQRRNEGTRQLNQFAIIFSDGFQCEGSDTSFAAVREGDVITLKGYHDVRGWPLLDPEWWECDEAQLVRIQTD